MQTNKTIRRVALAVAAMAGVSLLVLVNLSLRHYEANKKIAAKPAIKGKAAKRSRSVDHSLMHAYAKVPPSPLAIMANHQKDKALKAWVAAWQKRILAGKRTTWKERRAVRRMLLPSDLDWIELYGLGRGVSGMGDATSKRRARVAAPFYWAAVVKAEAALRGRTRASPHAKIYAHVLIRMLNPLLAAGHLHTAQVICDLYKPIGSGHGRYGYYCRLYRASLLGYADHRWEAAIRKLKPLRGMLDRRAFGNIPYFSYRWQRAELIFDINFFRYHAGNYRGALKYYGAEARSRAPFKSRLVYVLELGHMYRALKEPGQAAALAAWYRAHPGKNVHKADR